MKILSTAIIAILVLSGFAGIFIFENESVSAKTHYVGGTGANNTTTIQAAIDAASAGDTVYVYNGTYIEYLEKADRILTNKENGNRCYYPLRNEIEFAKLLENRSRFSRFSPIQQKILNTIKRDPGITQKELIKKTGLNRFTISYNIRKLIEMGTVKKSSSDKFVRYEYMTDKLLKHEMLLRLTIKLLNKEIDEQTFFELKNKLGIDQAKES